MLATDISRKVLDSAVNGIYSAEQISTLPVWWRNSYFVPLPDGMYQVKKELSEMTSQPKSTALRQQVVFRQFNLMNPLPFKKKMHVIFLRNVMIYFDETTKRKLVQRLYEFLEPGGYLIIGSTENIDRSAVPLVYVRPSIFRKE